MLTGREALERGRALRLRAIAVDGVSVVAEPLELLGDAVGAVLGAREDEKRALLFGEHLVQQAELLVLHDGVDAKLHAIGRLGGGADLDTHRVLDVVLHDLGDVGVERRGVAHGLARLGRAPTMRRMAGRKPMSSMRSTSSRTSMSTEPMLISRRRRKSSRRPGVATTRRGPRSR